MVGFWICFKVESLGPAKLLPFRAMAGGHIRKRIILKDSDSITETNSYVKI